MFRQIGKILTRILNYQARMIISKYKPFIVAVTGSVGKTSTKDAIYTVLAGQKEYVRKSAKSMNSEIGLPLTIIGAPNAWRSVGGWLSNIFKGFTLILFKHEYPSCLVLEIGADHPGDIESVTKWLKPDISVITKVSKVPVHVEFFSSPEQVFKEKSFLAKAVKPTGTLILFSDDEQVMSLGDEARARGVRVVSYGLNYGATVRGTEYEIDYADLGRPKGFTFKMGINGQEVKISAKGIVGETYMLPMLAGGAVGMVKGMEINKIAESLSRFEGPRGRMCLIPGKNGSMIVDDTYNSSPDAVLSALETVKSIKTRGKKVVVLGDMMELGKFSVEEHKKVGREVSRIADLLIAVGPRTKGLGEEALKTGLTEGKVKFYTSSTEAALEAVSWVGEGDVVLIKGSQSPRMERVVQALMENEEKAGDLLVRQEKEWLLKKS